MMKMGFLHKLPDWLESRKFAWGILTFIGIIFLAIIGTIASFFEGIDLSLIEQAMYLITGSGLGGGAGQTVVDTVRVKNNPTPETRTWKSDSLTNLANSSTPPPIIVAATPSEEAEVDPDTGRRLPKTNFGS